MLRFTSTADLLRLHNTDPALPVVTKLANSLFSENQPVTITLMQSHDITHPLAKLYSAEDVSLEGVIEQGGMFIIAMQTDYGYGLVFVVPNAKWLSDEFRRCIELNLNH